MNRNTTLIATASVLIAGVAAFAFLRPGSTDESSSVSQDPTPRPSASTGDSVSADLKPTRKLVRESKEDEAAALIEQYGDSRTALSRQVVDNVTSLLDDVLEMGDMMTSGQGGQFGGGDQALRGVLRGTGVELDETQKEAASELFREYQKRELEKTRNAVESLKEQPVTLMSLMLASDARSRDEISEEEYKALQEQSSGELEGILNPLDRNNFRGGQPMEDPAFRSGFEALLNEDQSSKFDTAMSEREASEDNSRQQTSITEMPVMDLESLDKSISSAKQMTTGFKSIMQGMGNLQELEQQRQGE
ncbi:hypothetical protein ACFQY0_05565 [Haloferula chungangensis]|uniref:Uncharacterized protein n=1 Tax=Haloferula chungangensis TaxID=1048331 RepID=A0ABW2L570_9BACT